MLCELYERRFSLRHILSNIHVDSVLAVAIGKCVGFFTVAGKIYKNHQVTRKSLIYTVLVKID